MNRRLAALAAAVAVLAVAVVSLLASGGDPPDRVESLTERLRCPGCGPTVAGSETETADEIRELVRQQTEAGWTDQMVLDDFAARYGAWIRREPPTEPTPWRWVPPALAVVLGAGLAGWAPGRIVPGEGAGRTVAVGGGLGLVAVGCLAAGAFLVAGGSVDEAPPSSAELAGLEVDPTEVSDEELERVVEANPDIVPMRLALVERLLDAGRIEDAHAHTARLMEGDHEPVEQQRILKFHGWTAALLGDPVAGADLLEASLDLVPEDRDARWFLANVRFHGLDDPAAARDLLVELLAGPMDDDQRRVVEAELGEVETALEG